MQERSDGIRSGFAELVERDLLPLLNLMVLLLPLVLVGLEFATRSAIAITLPDPSPDVATLDTPPAPRRRALGAEHHTQSVAVERTPREAEPETELPTPSSSVFSDSPLGYGG
jgi:hypothetical protein